MNYDDEEPTPVDSSTVFTMVSCFMKKKSSVEGSRIVEFTYIGGKSELKVLNCLNWKSKSEKSKLNSLLSAMNFRKMEKLQVDKLNIFNQSRRSIIS